MDEYRRPIKANRYWNRPKPKVYECNMRDAERMYQDSYKEYLSEKNFRIMGSSDWSRDKGDRYAHLRAGPLRREQSAQPFLTRHSESSSSAIEGLRARTSLSRDIDTAESTTNTKFEAKPVPAYDPQRENQNLEERLARLKRLREDLGLPNDTDSSKTTLRESRDSASRTFSTDNNDNSYKSERLTRLSTRNSATNNESSYNFKTDNYKSERSARINGIGGSSAEDTYSVTPKLEKRTERKREEVNITPKLERKTFSSKADLDDDYTFNKSEKKTERFSKISATAASSSSPIRTRKAAPSTKETLDVDDEDDAVLAKMMKKLPSSQEILERISKMDLDD